MLMERNEDEGPTTRISNDQIIKESEAEKRIKLEASNEKVKRLSQQHDEELRLLSDKQLKEQET